MNGGFHQGGLACVYVIEQSSLEFQNKKSKKIAKPKNKKSKNTFYHILHYFILLTDNYCLCINYTYT